MLYFFTHIVSEVVVEDVAGEVGLEANRRVRLRAREPSLPTLWRRAAQQTIWVLDYIQNEIFL